LERSEHQYKIRTQDFWTAVQVHISKVY
jgi:hypothetical protein